MSISSVADTKNILPMNEQITDYQFILKVIELPLGNKTNNRDGYRHATIKKTSNGSFVEKSALPVIY